MGKGGSEPHGCVGSDSEAKQKGAEPEGVKWVEVTFTTHGELGIKWMEAAGCVTIGAVARSCEKSDVLVGSTPCLPAHTFPGVAGTANANSVPATSPPPKIRQLIPWSGAALFVPRAAGTSCRHRGGDYTLRRVCVCVCAAGRCAGSGARAARSARSLREALDVQTDAGPTACETPPPRSEVLLYTVLCARGKLVLQCVSSLVCGGSGGGGVTSHSNAVRPAMLFAQTAGRPLALTFQQREGGGEWCHAGSPVLPTAEARQPEMARPI